MKLACAVVGIVGIASCTDITPNPINRAPTNTCPCDGFESTGRAAPICREGRCEVPTTEGRPDYPFWVVVHLPETSFHAPGSTYVHYSDKLGEPAFVPPEDSTSCPLLVKCIQLANLSNVRGSYLVTADASAAAGYPLANRTQIPVRVVYELTGNVQTTAFDAKLPLDTLFASSQLIPAPNEPDQRIPEYRRAIPYGRYRRVLYPQPPFDEYFPPTVDNARIEAGSFTDTFLLGGTAPEGKPLDEPFSTREATVSREAGLDGFRVWLQDAITKRRISILRTLNGKTVDLRLDTTGERRTPGGGLGDDVEAVIAPPTSWKAVPTWVSRLLGGTGLKTLNYPQLPAPAAVNGVVAGPDPESPTLLRGFPATVTFESDQLLDRGGTNPFLQYTTNVATDDRGRFATVLPPGSYRATVEPAIGTGKAVMKQSVVVDQSVTAITLQPPPLTIVRGRILLGNGQPLRDAVVSALPEAPANTEQMAKPRTGQTTTQPDGRFQFELDPGPYVLTVIPKEGTGFPWIATRKEIPAATTVLEDIKVPLPTRLSFVLRDPNLSIANPIAQAIVRIFAAVPGREAAPIEVGRGLSDTEGAVEILLAPEPR